MLDEVPPTSNEPSVEQETLEEISTQNGPPNKNVPQSYPSSPKCQMKFLQHQINQVLSKKNHESSSDSNAYHRCIHVYVHHHKVTKDSATNVNNGVLQPCHHKK